MPSIPSPIQSSTWASYKSKFNRVREEPPELIPHFSISPYSAIQIIDMASLAPSIPIIEVAQLGNIRGLSRTAGSSSGALNGPELASIILSVIILAGGLATAFCIACVRYKRYDYYDD